MVQRLCLCDEEFVRSGIDTCETIQKSTDEEKKDVLVSGFVIFIDDKSSAFLLKLFVWLLSDEFLYLCLVLLEKSGFVERVKILYW